MKLYITPTSPYARMARIVVLEKALEQRVEIIVAQTRTAGSPYYRINPSGRVPYLVRYDGVGFEESALICDYLDRLDGRPIFALPPGEEGWTARPAGGVGAEPGRRSRRLGPRTRPSARRAVANDRPTRSRRAERLADLWEIMIDHPLMQGACSMAQFTLACGLGLEVRNPDLQWRPGGPKLSTWFDRLTARPSLAATALPPRQGAAGAPELTRFS